MSKVALINLKNKTSGDYIMTALVVLTFLTLVIVGLAYNDPDTKNAGIYGLLGSGSGYVVGTIYNRAKSVTADAYSQLHMITQERNKFKDNFETLKEAFSKYLEELERLTSIPKPQSPEQPKT